METLSQLENLNVDELLDVLMKQIYESEHRLKNKSERVVELNAAITTTKLEIETILQTRQKLTTQITELVSASHFTAPLL